MEFCYSTLRLHKSVVAALPNDQVHVRGLEASLEPEAGLPLHILVRKRVQKSNGTLDLWRNKPLLLFYVGLSLAPFIRFYEHD